jgi:hypothetical protein
MVSEPGTAALVGAVPDWKKFRIVIMSAGRWRCLFDADGTDGGSDCSDSDDLDAIDNVGSVDAGDSVYDGSRAADSYTTWCVTPSRL